MTREITTQMSIGQSLLPEFDQEMASTRRLLQRVPAEQGPWKPHPKSFPLGHLAQLVSMMPGWVTTTVRGIDIDLAKGNGYTFEKTEKLLAQFDTHVREAREELATARDDDLSLTWSLKRGEQVLFAAPRGTVVRSHINHLIHHRGQLTVYLRLLDIPIPGMYGPTADERW